MSSIYIHIPFCKRKCVYCDFYSIEDTDLIPDYINALKKEIALYNEKENLSSIETIYLGGGTPSIIPLKYISEIFDLLFRSFKVDKDAEISIEVNPGTASEESLKSYLGMGINRISTGVQSFIQKELDFLKRIHSVSKAEQTLLSARENGFENISLDLIYAIPSSTIKDWEYNLTKAVEFNPEHISAYSLIYEEGTPLYKMSLANKVDVIPEEEEASMYEYTMNFLIKNGYNHYEVSNYAKPGFECRHNMNYWNHTEYIGFGPASHSFMNRKRWWNYKQLDRYIQMLSKGDLPVENMEFIDDHTFLEEKIYLGLRSGGINQEELKRKFNIDFFKKNENIITEYMDNEYIMIKNGIIRLTDKGFLLCDELCSRFKIY
jgi:oxygen-independent coproporphyrinogen III oxidase